ncbi:wd repeat-containing protein [Anaeramoeba flamelloides]|uniref:Wd repeat-containing protein n=1 Tax=Anaeramoeba flamelloides TaxID=1746091 RepID=A0AAV7YD44_9EUKA|nr:wd repeat-containing protein [Anaeramoeba flamelloides]
MNTTIRTIPHSPTKNNIGAVDCGLQGLIASAAGNSIIISKSDLTIISVLDIHVSEIVVLKWCPVPFQSNRVFNYNLLLLSGDLSGYCLISLPRSGKPIAILSDPELREIPIIDAIWSKSNPTKILTLHKGGIITLWSITKLGKEKPQRIWYQNLNLSIHYITLDPFLFNKLILIDSNGWVCEINENILDLPKAKEKTKKNEKLEIKKKYKINAIQYKDENNSPFQKKMKKKQETRTKKERKKRRNNKLKHDFICQVNYHPIIKNLLFFLNKRALLVFDTKINSMVCYMILEEHQSNFGGMAFSKNNTNIIYCYHRDGSPSVWQLSFTIKKKFIQKKKWKIKVIDIFSQIKLNKFRRNYKIFGIGILTFPRKSNKFCIICNDGLTTLWGVSMDRINKRPSIINKSTKLSSEYGLLKINKIQENITNNISCIVLNQYNSLIGIGNQYGKLQIYDLKSGEFNSTFFVFNSLPLSGITWIDKQTIIIFSSIPNNDDNLDSNNDNNTIINNNTHKNLNHNKIKNNSHYLNEISILDINSGMEKTLYSNKKSKLKINKILIANSKKVIAIIYNKKYIEIWKLKDFQMIQRINIKNKNNFYFFYSHAQKTNKNKHQMNKMKNKISLETDNEKEYFLIIRKEKKKILRYKISNENASFSITQTKPLTIPYSFHKINYATKKNNEFLLLHSPNGLFILLNLQNLTFDSIPLIELNKFKKIKQIVFNPKKIKNTIFIRFKNDIFCIYDLLKKKIQQKNLLKKHKIQNMFWTMNNNLVIVSNLCSIHLFFTENIHSSSIRIKYNQIKNVKLPSDVYLMNFNIALALKICLLFGLDSNEIQINKNTDNKLEISILKEIKKINKKIYLQLNSIDLIENRGKFVSNFYNNKNEFQFWDLVTIYINKNKLINTNSKCINGNNNANDFGNRIDNDNNNIHRCSNYQGGHNQKNNNNVGIGKRKKKKKLNEENKLYNVNYNIDLQCFKNKRKLKKKLKNKIKLKLNNNSLPRDHRLKKNIINQLLIIGNIEKVIALLLKTDQTDQDYILNQYKIMALAQLLTNEKYQLVLNDVINNFLNINERDKAIELMCLNNQFRQACKILIQDNKWEECLLIVNSNLKKREKERILKKYAWYLIKNNEYFKAASIFLQIGKYPHVLYSLSLTKLSEVVILFYNVCLNYNLFKKSLTKIKIKILNDLKNNYYSITLNQLMLNSYQNFLQLLSQLKMTRQIQFIKKIVQQFIENENDK